MAFRLNHPQILWFGLYVVSTLYTFMWDILQDWGLGYSAHGFLRRKRLFSRPWVSVWLSACSSARPTKQFNNL